MSAAETLAAAAAAIFVLLAVYRLRQRRPLRAGLGLALAGLLGLYAAGLLPGVPDPRHAIEESADALGSWAYLAVAGMAFFETGAPPFTLIFPGEWGVIYGGLLAKDGHVDLVPLILVVWAASALGDSWSFYIGRRFGRGYLVRHGGRLGVSHERLDALDDFFARWGAATVAVGRLVPIARPFVALVAGASAWPYARFLRWNLLGTAVFALAFTMLGFAAYATAERALGAADNALWVAAPVLAAVGFVVYRLRNRRPEPALERVP